MKFAVGYQLAEDGERPFVDVAREFREHLAEVYFPWLNMASGRAALTNRRGYVDWAGQRRLESDLRAFREMGLQLDLLFNANCYGRNAASQFLQNQVASVLEHLDREVGGVDVVTTTSLAIAQTVQKHFPGIDVRASVNMRLGTARSMQYVAGLFDSYYVQRDYNRDLGRVRSLRLWADRANKKLFMLVNSGCLSFCSGQVFHDNMVAHELEIDETHNIPGWTPHVCWNYFQDRANWVGLLQNTWIRPEDLHHYEDLFPVVKLATRMHSDPQRVIRAYVERKYEGNLLDLFEPGHGPIIAPHVIDNSRFPDDWFEHSTQCSQMPDQCDYCRETLERVLAET